MGKNYRRLEWGIRKQERIEMTWINDVNKIW